MLGWLIARQVELGEVGRVVRDSSYHLVLLAFLVFVGRLPLSGLRWKLLLGHRGYVFRTLFLSRILLISTFFAALLPGATGSDLARGTYLYRLDVPPRHVIGTVVADRAFGVVSLVLLSVPPALWLIRSHPELWSVYGTVGVLALGTCVATLSLPRLRACAQAPLAHARATTWLTGRLLRLVADLGELLHERRLLAGLLAISVAFQLLGVLSTYLVGKAVDVDLAPTYYLLFLPLVWLWTLLPVSVNGIGVREGAFLFYFGLAGVPAEKALAMSLLVLAQSLSLGLVGGVVAMLDRRLSDPQSGE